MKKLNFIPLLLLLVFLSSCIRGNYKVEVRFFGIEYDMGYGAIKVEFDQANERFIFIYNPIETETAYYYDVCFCMNFTTISNDSSDNENFDYKYENGEDIIFDNNGNLLLYDSVVLYTYYNNANDEIKKAINTGDFSIMFGSEEFFVYENNNTLQ